MTIPYIAAVLGAWPFIGLVALCLIDEDDRMLAWFREAPHWICKAAVLMAWPWFLFKYWRAKR